MKRPKKSVIGDTRFVEEGTIKRILELKNGKLIEISCGQPQFNDDFSGVIRGTKSRRLFYKYEVIRE